MWLKKSVVIPLMTRELLGIDAGRIAEYSADVLSEVFGFGDM